MVLRNRRLGVLGAGLALATLATLGLATPATASPTAGSKSGQACWVDVDTGKSGCAASVAQLDDAYFEGTGRTLVVGDKEAAQARSVGVLASYTMVRIYENINAGGASFDFVSTSSTPCASSLYNIDVMPSGWNDRLSSFYTYLGCKARISENTYQGGAYLGPIPGAHTVGAMNDKTSSMWITG